MSRRILGLATMFAVFSALASFGPARAVEAAPETKAVPAPRTVPDGVYKGASRGYVDDVTVQVTVTDGKIAEVRVLDQKESRARTAPADVPPKMVAKQGTQVDATTGATVTSRAIMRAAQVALESSAPIKLADVPDGTYTGVSRGRALDIAAEVTVQKGRIESVKLTGKPDAPRLPAAQEAQKVIPQRIVEKQSATVDVHPGAEATSIGIMRAVQAALESSVPRVLQPK